MRPVHNPTAVPRASTAAARSITAGESFDALADALAPKLDAPDVAERWAWSQITLGRRDAIVAVLIFLAALAARWPLIARGHTLLHSDEAIVGLMAQDIAAGERFPIYFYGQRYMGALEAYVIAALLPFVDRPITALRLGPALFFAALVAVQYLMLSRWFGRRSGLVGAATLICAAPMFAQWSISARGGYVEILLWGSLVLWAYAEWFVAATTPASPRRKAAFGALLGSGFWINPSIVVFVAPVIAVALLTGPWRQIRRSGVIGPLLDRLGLVALPVVGLVAVLLVNLLYAVWVEHGEVHQLVLLGLAPRPVAMALMGALGLFAIALIRRRLPRRDVLRPTLGRQAPFLFGALAGAAPAILYVGLSLLGRGDVEPSLPLGLRPIWQTGDTLLYLIEGLPLMLGADARSFLHLVTLGLANPLTPLSIVMSGVVSGANWLVLGSLATLGIIFVATRRDDLSRLLRLDPRRSPVTLLLLGAGGMLALYVLSACAFDFNSIRYLLPLWAFLPGLLAALVSRAQSADAPDMRRPAGLTLAALLVAWTVGQVGLAAQIGRPHPLADVAGQLVARGVPTATAELFDSHYLSYLTGQRCRVAEYAPFWGRLGHYRATADSARPAHYLVDTSGVDWTIPFSAGGYLGDPPPETQRSLWPCLRHYLHQHPQAAILRERLPCGYELIALDHPLDAPRR